MGTRNKFLVTQDGDRAEWSISNTGSDIILKPDINIDTSDITKTQKRQGNQQQGYSKKWRQRQGIKRSQQDMPFVSYEEPKDDLNDLDQPK